MSGLPSFCRPGIFEAIAERRRFVLATLKNVEPAIQRAKAAGPGLALDPQHPVVTERQFEVMAGLVSAADFPGADELGDRKFNANALPARAEAAHAVAPLAICSVGCITPPIGGVGCITLPVSVAGATLAVPANAGSLRL